MQAQPLESSQRERVRNVPAPIASAKNTTLGVLVVAALAAALFVVLGGSDSSPTASAAEPEIPGTPRVELISPRNGAVQRGTAVVVKADVENFQLSPQHF